MDRNCDGTITNGASVAPESNRGGCFLDEDERPFLAAKPKQL